MAEKISELTGEARDKRIAELKQKMQEAAKRAQAAHKAGESPAQASEPEPAAPVPSAQPAATAAATTAQATVTRPAREAPSTASGNGATAPEKPAATPAPRPTAPRPTPAAASSEPSTAEMNRREFLTYAWGAALGLLAVESGVASFFFMYPRFKAGEFGGKFFIGPESALPDPSMAPQPYTSGKFWLVRTEEDEPKALYMVCTHLGCLYKWEASNVRFECPCHGSKFTHDGFYIEGPAPRSLDYFEISIEEGEVVVDTGSKIIGDPSGESPARAVPA